MDDIRADSYTLLSIDILVAEGSEKLSATVVFARWPCTAASRMVPRPIPLSERRECCGYGCRHSMVFKQI